MTQSTPITVIKVTAQKIGGMLYASSADIFGLHIAAKSEEQLAERLIIGIKWLFKQNHKMDVDVNLSAKPSDFASHKFTASLDQLIVSAAA